MLTYVGVLSWLLFGVVSAVVASNKGRSGCAWFGLGVLLGPIGLILAFAVQPPHAQVPPANPQPSALKKCPACAELIRQDAVKCRFCGEKLTSSRGGPSAPEGFWACPRCGAAVGDNVSQCGNCGYSTEV